MKKLDILSPQESGTHKRGPLAENWKNCIAWVLRFWDSLKEKWKKAKQNFWWKEGREQFVQNLIAYNQWRAEWLEQNAGELEAIGYADFSPDAQQKFEEEFLRDLILYQQCASPIEREEITRDNDVEPEEVDSLAKRNLKPGEILDLEWKDIGDEWAKALAQMELKEGVEFNLRKNNIGDDWVKVLAQMELKEGVSFKLGMNKIGDEWAKALAQMKLQPGVELDLWYNNIGDEWAKALAQMELQPGVILDLWHNKIGDEWAKALAQMELKPGVTINLEENNIRNEWVKALAQMELKEGVTINLLKNKIWSEGKAILQKWRDDARARGVNCKVSR